MKRNRQASNLKQEEDEPNIKKEVQTSNKSTPILDLDNML